MQSTHAPAHNSPKPAAAARMRAIGLHRRRPATRCTFGFLCGPCNVAWAGAEADCFSCGLPATQKHRHPRTTLQVLLVAVGRFPGTKTEPGQREEDR
ncbi:hypothetical protein AB0919_39690 [Streptomyces sp. NPDC046994]|uniref:hypothetical protein n=1 Tax=Streptomyces sp. NPDC046994 TaxID=3155735 RepID=UPI0034542AD8